MNPPPYRLSIYLPESQRWIHGTYYHSWVANRWYDLQRSFGYLCILAKI